MEMKYCPSLQRKKTVVLNTLANTAVATQLVERLDTVQEVQVFHTSTMQISHCMGCTHCLLKTPGVCAIKDDYVQILRALAHSQNLWLITGTSFGFMNAQGKKVMDRVLPLLNMGLEFRDGQMRHTLRYGALNVGVVYQGNADESLLDFWSRRAAMNLGGISLGAYSAAKIGEEIGL